MTWLDAAAGFDNGPRRLKIVLVFISLRGAIAYFMALWNRGAYMKPMPISRMHFSTVWAEAFKFTPNASRTSADTHWLDAERLPCFATLSPQPATTKAAAVEMLNVFALLPPVPQVSTRSFP